MLAITHSISNKFESATIYCKQKMNSVTQKVRSLQTTIFSEIEPCQLMIRKWAPLAIGCAVCTYLVPYFMVTVAIISVLTCYYREDLCNLIFDPDDD